MSEQIQINKCSHCNNELTGDFCSNCGQPKTLTRINGSYVLSEIGSIFNFDKGILYTIKELILRPGLSVQKFIHEDRQRLVKPIVFIIICSLLYTLFQQVFHFEDGYVNYSDGNDSTASFLFEWVSKNYGYANIIMALFVAIWIKIFFWKSGYNFFEILILLCFTMGVGMLLFSIFGAAESLSGLKIVDKGALFTVLFISWAIGQFFGNKKILNYLKAFFSYMLGFLTFAIATLLIGQLIDLIK